MDPVTSGAVAPVLLVGAGRLGGALIQGWTRTGAVRPSDLIILAPRPGPVALEAAAAGAKLNPPEAELARAGTVVLAVKPQVWREVAQALASHLAPSAIVVSVAAGVKVGDLSAVFGGRPAARTIPTTAVALGKGAAAIFASSEVARAAAHGVLDSVATCVDLFEEDQMDLVIGVCGSAPGFFYAFVEALEEAGIAAGLPPDASRTLARVTIAGSAAMMADTGAEPADLRREVASPKGTTEAGLSVLDGEDGLPGLLKKAVLKAAERARELGA
jgi:pyrroline-5-carboxylate reductase